MVDWHQWEYSSTQCYIAFCLRIRRFLNFVKDPLFFISLHACLLSSTTFPALIFAFICLDNAPVLVSWTWRPAVVPITQGPAVCRFSRPDCRLTRPSPLPRALPSLRPSRWTLSSLNLCFVSYLYISAQKLVSFVWSKWGFHCCRFFLSLFFINAYSTLNFLHWTKSCQFYPTKNMSNTFKNSWIFVPSVQYTIYLATCKKNSPKHFQNLHSIIWKFIVLCGKLDYSSAVIKCLS